MVADTYKFNPAKQTLRSPPSLPIRTIR